MSICKKHNITIAYVDVLQNDLLGNERGFWKLCHRCGSQNFFELSAVNASLGDCRIEVADDITTLSNPIMDMLVNIEILCTGYGTVFAETKCSSCHRKTKPPIVFFYVQRPDHEGEEEEVEN